jgi:putative transposase
MERFCASARYAWNWGLAEYESALDDVRGARAKGSVRGVLEARVRARGITVSRKGAGTMPLKTVLYALWRGHRSSAPGWVTAGVHSHVASHALQRLCNAIARWWAAKGRRLPWVTASERRAGKIVRRGPGRAGSQGKRIGPPRYKRRDAGMGFTIQASDGTAWAHRHVRVPGGLGWVRVSGRTESPRQRIPQGAVAKSLTVRKVADQWEASICVVEPWEEPARRDDLPCCGIDLGMNAEATIAWSDGRIERVAPPMPLAAAGVRLVLLQRRLSRSRHVLRCVVCGHETALGPRDTRIRVCRQDGCQGRIRRWRSNGGMRLKMQIAKLHARVARIRSDHLHKLSHRLTRDAAAICTEPHNVTGLVSAGVARRVESLRCAGLRRRDIRRAMLDIGWGEFRRQCAYKTVWRARTYTTVPAGTRTDRECHRCGVENAMPPGNAYACAGCGWVGRRQDNTALLCLRYIAPSWIPGGDPGQPAGEPVVGGHGDTAEGERGDILPVDSRGSGLNGVAGDITPGGSKPPGGSRFSRSFPTAASAGK